jgi:peptidoglycan/xylan/chitin deacetylase (PgdA/CDA1 family)
MPPILMYHEVTAGPPEEMHAVSQAAFSAQMLWLRQAGYQSVSLAEWLAPAAGAARPAPPNPIVITFDDGYRDNYTNAWPILAEQGFSATIFLVTGRLGGSADWRPGALGQAPLLTWPDVREMALAGLQFGSHTASHVDLSACPLSVAQQELRVSRETLQQALGAPVATLAYPFSRFNAQIKASVRQAGYEVACSCPTGYVGAANRDPYDLRRVTVLAGDQLTDFAAMVRGHWRRRLSWYRRVVGLWHRRLVGARS